eukprot:28514-Amphidinium_carterae.1
MFLCPSHPFPTFVSVQHFLTRSIPNKRFTGNAKPNVPNVYAANGRPGSRAHGSLSEDIQLRRK